jgi:hypothetical protein
VKHDTVVEPIFHELFDARDMTGRKIRPHLDYDFSLGGFQRQRIFGLRHLTPFRKTKFRMSWPDLLRVAAAWDDKVSQRSIVAFLM